ncbi:MAG: M55 family metallopeptidase [Anaerolineae bacterium]|jgi:D-amino peptidase|nr:M55 family metallopeptidase [Anaerolineae bacterium]
MKVLMMTDLEGVAGVVTFEQDSYSDGKYYEAAKQLLTAEVNASVDGLLDAGAEEVLVLDMHGPGGIAFGALHPAARLMHGRPLAPQAVRDAVYRTYDVSVIIGQHALAGIADGNLAHTQSSRSIDIYTLNGKPIGEIAQWALYCGALGLPVIFLSGDQAACREIEDLIPGVTTAAVKQGLSRTSAITLSKEASRELIRSGSRLALERQRSNPIAPLVWEPPYVLEKRYFHSDSADAAASQPGVERIDSQTVRLRSDSILDLIYR